MLAIQTASFLLPIISNSMRHVLCKVWPQSVTSHCSVFFLSRCYSDEGGTCGEDCLYCSGRCCRSRQNSLVYTVQELYLPTLKKGQNVTSSYAHKAALSSVCSFHFSQSINPALGAPQKSRLPGARCMD